MAVRKKLVEGADAAAGLPVSARIVELEIGSGRPFLDGEGIAEDAREHPSTDACGAYGAELAGSCQIKIPIRLTDVALRTQSQSMPIFSSGGRVEGRRTVVGAEVIEIEVHGQEVRRRGGVETKELMVRARLVEFILVHDDRLSPKRSDGPVGDPNDRLTAVKSMGHLREVARPDQPLGAVEQLLTAAAQGYARVFAERNHDVGKTVKEVGLIVESGAVAPLKIAIRRQRAFPFEVEAKVGSDVQIGIEPEPGQEISIRALRRRGAELKIVEVFETRPGLAADAQPDALIGGERDKFHAVPKIIGLARIHPFQGRPILVEP